jgi:hypothetical protein
MTPYLPPNYYPFSTPLIMEFTYRLFYSNCQDFVRSLSNFSDELYKRKASECLPSAEPKRRGGPPVLQHQGNVKEDTKEVMLLQPHPTPTPPHPSLSEVIRLSGIPEIEIRQDTPAPGYATFSSPGVTHSDPPPKNAKCLKIAVVILILVLIRGGMLIKQMLAKGDDGTPTSEP